MYVFCSPASIFSDFYQAVNMKLHQDISFTSLIKTAASNKDLKRLLI